MKSSFSPDRHPGCVEVLEQRIAPAGIKILSGLPDTGSTHLDLDYADPVYAANAKAPVFVNTMAAAPNGDLISAAVGGDGSSYYIKLSAGDQLFIWGGSAVGFGNDPFVNVTKGTAVLFFEDKNHDGEVGRDELVGVSMGKGAALRVGGAVNGDIVANLNDAGTALLGGPAANDGNGLSMKQGIANLEIGSDVVGKIIAGGNVSNVLVHGGFGALLAGSSANTQTYNFFPGFGGTDHTISYTPGVGQVGASVTNIFANTITGLIGADGVTLLGIDAGGGGAGATGGSISKVTVANDTVALAIKAGAGGDAGLGKVNGGAGGKVTNVYVAGTTSTTSLANLLIDIEGGSGGGNAMTGKGGAGGGVSNIHVGYLAIGGHPFQEGNLISDVQVGGGVGGTGKSGGAGGAVSAITIQTQAQLHVNVTDPANEMAILGGAGGATLAAGGSAGRGGALSSLVLEDVGVTNDASIFVQGGDGGLPAAGGKGAAGGSVSTVSMVAGSVHALAGNGSSGTIGGAGGALSGITVHQEASIFTHLAEFSAGFGGDGSIGNGGAGGLVAKIVVENSDLGGATINAGNAGNGGNGGASGVGGVGGGISSVNIIDSDNSAVSGTFYSGTFTARTGNGGNGGKGGGKGGSVLNERFVGVDVSNSLIAGFGGNATTSGNGGAGGSIQAANISALFSSSINPDIVITAGAGGSGLGTHGAGGAGGGLSTVSANADDNVALSAGNGGGGVGGAAGKGGTISASAAFGTLGDGTLFAGNAGTTGAKPGIGGSVIGTSAGKLSGLYAAGNVTIEAGNGSFGGAGGAIKYVGYGSTSSSLTPTPTGNILVQAGNGSAFGTAAGAGGSITNLFGSVTSGGVPGTPTTTQILAGNGAGVATKASAGGSISNVIVERGGFSQNVSPTGVLIPLDPGSAILTIQAGDAGPAASASTGAKGGSVTSVAVSDIGGTLFRSIAAGNGGDAAKHGGAGGSVTQVGVLGTSFDPNGLALPAPLPGDIGQRTGAVFGFASMGGIFAGTGGLGASAGVAGSVSVITADSIASIVAGRNAAPEEVTSVNHIYLNGNRLLHDSLGAFLPPPLGSHQRTLAFDPTYYASANLVGAISDINRANAWQFQYTGPQTGFVLGDVPIDGIVMTLSLDQSTINFTPEARLVGTQFFDFNNQI